jgi:2-hydroxychromene-2-carboxylate isomerase
MKTFEFWFDFGSTASYLAWTQLPALEAATGARAVLKPMLLGGVFQATGNQSPANIPAKGKYIFVDFARFAERYGVTLNRNPYFPINTLLLMRGAIALQMSGDARLMDYCHAVFEAIWVDSLNMNDPATAAETLGRAAMPGPWLRWPVNRPPRMRSRLPPRQRWSAAYSAPRRSLSAIRCSGARTGWTS